ncbi:hypothetical protein Lal_00018743 [Lupinus albus]|nr:hypothetical protein Lal_00018743 [Lupinus albus]
MSLATLLGKLQEHQIELGRLTLHEESDKKKKGISIKATISNTKVQEHKSNEEEYDSSDIANETMTLLVNKFSKFLKNKGGFIKFQRRDTRDSTKRASAKRTKSLATNGGKLDT